MYNCTSLLKFPVNPLIMIHSPFADDKLSTQTDKAPDVIILLNKQDFGIREAISTTLGQLMPEIKNKEIIFFLWNSNHILGKNVFQWTKIICANIFTHKCDARHQLNIFLLLEHSGCFFGRSRKSWRWYCTEWQRCRTHRSVRSSCAGNTNGRSYNHSKFLRVRKHTSL